MKLLSYLLLLFPVWIFAQTPVKYGNVSKKELTKSESAYGKDIAAEILSSEEKLLVEYDDSNHRFSASKTVSVRIKIYHKNQAPDDLMNIKIPLRLGSGGNDEKIMSLKATTYTMENGNVVKSKLSKSNVYKEQVHKYLRYKKFAFPNVKDGAVLEYKYTISSPYFWDSKTWYFQSEVPVLYSRFYTKYPEFFVYQPDMRGEYSPKIEKTSSNGSDGYNFKQVSYVCKNLAGLNDEPFVLNPNNMKSSLRMELIEYNYPGVGYKNFAATWEGIIKDLNKNSSFGHQLNNTDFLSDKVTKITNGAKSEMDKTRLIFDYVKNNYTWNQYHSLYTNKGIRQTFKTKTGNIADINLLLVAMLQKAHITAFPVVLSSVDNGMLNFFPSQQKLNYVIAVVYSGDAPHLMDATEKYSKIDMLPLRALNFKGFQVMNNGRYKELNLVNQLVSENKDVVRAKINPDLSIAGQFAKTYSNYYAMNKIEDLEENPTELKSDFAKKYDVEMQNLSMRKGSNNDAIRFTFKFASDAFIESIGDKIILSPLLFLQQKENPLKQDNRKFPLEFGTPYSESKQISIVLPEGYTATQLPETFTYKLPNGAGGFVLQYSLNKNILSIISVERINYSALPQSYFAPIKEMYQKKVEKEKQQIILSPN